MAKNKAQKGVKESNAGVQDCNLKKNQKKMQTTVIGQK